MLQRCNWSNVVDRLHIQAQIDNLANSPVLHGSESLCKLLRYMAKHALDHPGAPLKEYQIATEVFGRQETSTPRLTPWSASRPGRLRAKLAEYYNRDGAVEDPVWVELPKGTYVLAFHPRNRRQQESRVANHRVPARPSTIAEEHPAPIAQQHSPTLGHRCRSPGRSPGGFPDRHGRPALPP